MMKMAQMMKMARMMKMAEDHDDDDERTFYIVTRRNLETFKVTREKGKVGLFK